MKRCLPAFALCVHAAAAAGDAITVQLTDTRVSAPLPPDFVSFSIGVSGIVQVLVFPPASAVPRPSWTNLMKNLRSAVHGGPGGVGPNIRVGGASADFSVYCPDTSIPLPVNDTYRITEADFGKLVCELCVRTCVYVCLGGGN